MATAEAAKMAEAAEMTEAAVMAGGAAIVEAEAVNIAAGADVSKIKTGRIPNPEMRPLTPTSISIQNPTKPRNAQTLGLGRLSLQALAWLWPHATPRASGMKRSTGWQTAVLPTI